MDTPQKLRARLDSCIDVLAEHPERYARRPGADFTRTRRIGFGDLVRALVCMGTGTLGAEMAAWMGGPRAPSASAFCQQRAKLDPEALRQLLLGFSPDVPAPGPWKGRFALAAVDGTEIVMQRNPRDAETYNPKGNGRSGRGYNSVYATALYDIARDSFVDAVVQPGPRKDEHGAFRELVDRNAGGDLLVLGDRGFASYNGFAHCIEGGVRFVVRLNDRFARGLLGLAELPDEADEAVALTLTRSRSAAARGLPGYRLVGGNVRFDYLPEGSPAYGLRLRVVRVRPGGGPPVSLATDLPRDLASPSELGELYAMRWGVETSFRGLKHSVGLARLHSATARGAAQEVYARMVLYNFCSAMAALAALAAPPREGCKWEYAVSFAAAVRVCRGLLRARDGPAGDPLRLIAANVCPVRPGRSHERHRRLWSPGNFAYRC